MGGTDTSPQYPIYIYRDSVPRGSYSIVGIDTSPQHPIYKNRDSVLRGSYRGDRHVTSIPNIHIQGQCPEREL